MNREPDAEGGREFDDDNSPHDPDRAEPPDGADAGGADAGGADPAEELDDDGLDTDVLDTAEFEAIVAGWREEGKVPEWPADGGAALFERPVPTPAELRALVTPPVVVPATAAVPAAEEDHFVPADPPPLPRLGVPVMVGLALLGLGLILVTSPGWVGVPVPYGLPLGLLALAGGLGWLVLRLWPAAWAEDRDDGDDGAVL